ncbi:MAG: TonB-dependent receptor [Flavobacteriales bacterium]|nr:TonB-dependent receptor [Flavobacteriales bacterium]
MKYRNLIASMVLMTGLFAQSIVGTIVDVDSNPLEGANVVVLGTDLGGVSDETGAFSINVSEGTYDVVASFIGYSSITKSVVVEGVSTLEFVLDFDVVSLSDVEVLASRASETTPVAYTNVSKEEMEVRLGSQDIPMILNTTPSVYATQQGGGAGDARINIRGFNQRNVAVMINGVPQNDMENGWVYWSNWDGVGDATSSIQVQRGLSAVNLATPSIGGTMNIITDPTSFEKGGKFKQEAGDGGFLKTTFNYNTGLLLNDKLALSGTIVRKTGDGIIDGTWTDAWAYYFGGSYAVSEDQRFELYAIGAPQRHGQNLYKQNIATYSQELAGSVDGYDTTAFSEGNKFETEAGRLFNQNVAPIDPSYTGQQYWYMYGARTTNRFNKNFLNERENFFHKPLVNLNHFLTINDKTRLSSVLYWSGGSGGGTGTYGSVSRTPAVEGERWYASSPWAWDWNAEIAQNSDNIDENFSTTENRSTGILRNSINRQNTYGLISKLNYELNDNLELQVGLDWRTARIEHAREVRDLLGGDYYVDYADDNFEEGKVVRLGDEIAYHNETTVDWLGGFVQGNYTTEKLNLYGMGGVSSIEYSYQDHFTIADEVITADPITTYQVKGGALYNVNENLGVFINSGYVQKAPILDNVITYDGVVATDPDNEKFLHNEFGANFGTQKLGVRVSAYNTDWQDRNLTKSVQTGQGSSGDTDVIFLKGVNQKHQGLEIETKIQPNDMVELDLIASFGNWKFDGDADGTYQENEYNDEGQVIGYQTTDYAYALDGLYVGDMPQTAYILGVTLKPIKGLRLQALYKTYDKNYSDWSPDAREIEDGVADRSQVWEAPGYSKLDLHASYKLPIKGYDISLNAHVFNALDEVFVQDAVDNSKYNGFGDKLHLAHNAEVFLGTPRYANIGVSINF